MMALTPRLCLGAGALAFGGYVYQLRTTFLELQADVLLTPSTAHVLLGFSFHFGQYWQYRASNRDTTWSTAAPISLGALAGRSGLRSQR